MRIIYILNYMYFENMRLRHVAPFYLQIHNKTLKLFSTAGFGWLCDTNIRKHTQLQIEKKDQEKKQLS